MVEAITLETGELRDAWQLARRMAKRKNIDVSTIRAACRNTFSEIPRDKEIAAMIARERAKKVDYSTVGDADPEDIFNFRVAGLPNPVEWKQPKKPRKSRAKRKRDFININRGTIRKDLVFKPAPGLADRLVKSVADDFGISVAELRGKGRQRYLVAARSVVTKLLRARGWSYPQIAPAIGRSDHSTTINQCRKFDYYAKVMPIVRESYQQHIAMLEGEGDSHTAIS